MAEGSRFVASLKRPGQWIGLTLIIVVVGAVAVGPIAPASHGRQNARMQISRTLAIAMFEYASDHDGAYPTGKSSTEVFQKLVDENYISDPAIFCWENNPPPGKTKATSNVLKPENVCWDVTVPMNTNAPDALPVVFWTGFKVSYVHGGKAVPLSSSINHDGLPVSYRNNTARWLRSDGQADGIVTNFISSDFVPDGKTYRQLTPEGPLVP